MQRQFSKMLANCCISQFIAQHAAKLYSLLGQIFIAKIEEQISFGLVLCNTVVYNY